MHPLFRITVEQIRRLNDEQARELVARLSRAELKKASIDDAVTWGGDQRAPDGGIDVRVDIESGSAIHGFVKANRTGFQVKAEPFSAAKIKEEMAPEGTLRPSIRDLSGGAYIIVSTKDNLSDSSLAARKDAMRNCLVDAGIEAEVVTDFYDARKLADWVEANPAVGTWLRGVIGEPLEGWRPYGPWAYQETSAEAQYLLDERVKVFTPHADEGIDAVQAIEKMRDELSHNAAIRLVGLSGVGKTRLVQALFDARIESASPALSVDDVIYTDISYNPIPLPSAMIEALASDGSSSVVVVDNCSAALHRLLVDAVKKPGSQLKLITIEYDIRDDLPEGTICYRLEGSSDDIVKELLKRKYKFLSGRDIDKIAEFSDGNARVAFALAETTRAAGELGRLRDAELFRRLFVQSNNDNDELLRCAEAVSLLYSFDGEDVSANSELSILASLAGVDVHALFRNVAILQSRGLVQARGKWRALLPHAIANRLASQAIDAIPPSSLIKAFVELASDRVARSFSRRLGYLHESPKAIRIVKEWLAPQGRYGDLSRLDELAREIFTNIAPVHPDAALSALERAIQNPEFVSTENPNRAYYARLARSIAFDPALFDRAVGVLIEFALAEPEDHREDPARDTLKSLFFAHLSGTEALPARRAGIVRGLLDSGEDRRRALGLSLLEAALEATHFSSLYDFDFGARKRGYGWFPRTYRDVRTWYGEFLDIVVGFLGSNSILKFSLCKLLGSEFRGLWVNAGLTKELSGIASKLQPGGWPEGWLGARAALRWDKDKINTKSLEALKKVEALLAPIDLRSQIVARLMTGRFEAEDVIDDVSEDDENDPVDRYTRGQDAAERLGRVAAQEKSVLFSLIPDLLKQEINAGVFSFGVGVGKELEDVDGLLARIRQELDKAPSASLIFVRGVITGRYQVKPDSLSSFFDEAVTDKVWGISFPELQVRVPLNEEEFNRIMRSIESGIAPAWQYRYLAGGRATDAFSPMQVVRVAEALAARGDEGLFTAVDLLSMQIHLAEDKDEKYRKDDDYREKLRTCCLEFSLKCEWSALFKGGSNVMYDALKVLKYSLRAKEAEQKVEDLLKNVLKGTEDKIHVGRRGDLLKPFLQMFPEKTLNILYVPDASGSYRLLRRLLQRDHDRNETALAAVPTNKLIAWCKESPDDRFPFAADNCRLFAPKQDSEPLAFSDAIIGIVSESPDKRRVLDGVLARLRPSSWSGSRAAIMKKRLELLPSLNPGLDSMLSDELAKARQDFIKEIELEEQSEQRSERDESGFE